MNEKAKDAALRAKIVGRLSTTGYIPLDHGGRMVTHPLAARTYLAWTRKCQEHLRSDPHATVSLQYGFPKGSAEFREEWLEVLNKRINLAGGLTIREHRDGEVELRRDQQAVHDMLQRRIRGYGLQTRLAKKQLPEVVAIMEANRSERD